MATNVFVSFDHDDQGQVGAFKLLKSNPNHPLDFHDHSLKDPILGATGKPLKYPPTDTRSKPVRDAIRKNSTERPNWSFSSVTIRTRATGWIGRSGLFIL